MDARTSKRQKRVSRKQEERMAEDLGGRAQPASGALPGAKGDVRKFGVVRAEAKYTAKSSYILKLSDLDKIIGEAGLDNAVLQLCFVDRANRPVAEFAIYPMADTKTQLTFQQAADLQTFSARTTIDRDRTILKLMKKNIYIVFSKRQIDGSTHHRWFCLHYWKDYLKTLEGANA